MLKIDMEFRKGILFIRLCGKLNKYTVHQIDENVIPVILKHGLKFIVVNVDKLESIDSHGIETLIKLNELVSKWNGKTTLCSLNKYMKDSIYNTDLKNKYFETSDELTAIEVFKIWQKK